VVSNFRFPVLVRSSTIRHIHRQKHNGVHPKPLSAGQSQVPVSRVRSCEHTQNVCLFCLDSTYASECENVAQVSMSPCMHASIAAADWQALLRQAGTVHASTRSSYLARAVSVPVTVAHEDTNCLAVAMSHPAQDFHFQAAIPTLASTSSRRFYIAACSSTACTIDDAGRNHKLEWMCTFVLTCFPALTTMLFQQLVDKLCNAGNQKFTFTCMGHCYANKLSQFHCFQCIPDPFFGCIIPNIEQHAE
jgi:hypothetical protein